ncbi:MAG: SSU ribosomal protein S8e [Candidatus Fermentimicrarchaeum limneticum]|uniref:Small ribosomal subunit protein eS8 n=1 Tax=Fermentimicrarchaeum limneticum TaxID=2795018 RepID=A0A7D6BC48_FERL1|nr:MAG: SSU ribosomal protein S8e [Candidatus Fermentimicrarchaeum limneticum]
MEQFHGKPGRKTSGSGKKQRKFRDKHLSEVGGSFSSTKIDEKAENKTARTRGGNFKVKLKRAAFANISTPEGIKKAKIKSVAESPDNRHHARMNIITKGAVIETEIGKARVTSRPGQHGVVNAVLLQK